MKITISQTGIPDVRANLLMMRARLGDFMVPLKKGAVLLLDAAVTNIDRGGDPPWVPRKREPKDGHHILILTGSLRNSLSSANTNAIGAEGRYRVNPGTNIVYARALQYGYPAGNLPARPYLYATHDQAEKIAGFVRDYLLNKGESLA